MNARQKAARSGTTAGSSRAPRQQTLAQEAKFLENRLLTHELLEVFAGQTEGTQQQRQELAHAVGRLGPRIYVEAVYGLTHTLVLDKKEARVMFEQIREHQQKLIETLKRPVSIQVAALDYLQDVRHILKAPTIIETDKCDDFARRATVDETTQAYDKQLMDSDLDAEIERARRTGSSLSALFLDIDNLKKINDVHGHAVGTEAIRFVSVCINRTLRKYDAVYRYGGDEFVALMSRTDSAQARRIARRIVRSLSINRPAELPVKPGVSIGIATYEAGVIDDKRTLLAAADTALYRAKENGKNTVCVYGDACHDHERSANQSIGHSRQRRLDQDAVRPGSRACRNGDSFRRPTKHARRARRQNPHRPGSAVTRRVRTPPVATSANRCHGSALPHDAKERGV